MQINHAEDTSNASSLRGSEREFKTLLTGDENAPDNFKLYLVRQSGDLDLPRHKHNFDQVRMCLEGDPQNFGKDKWIRPGEIAYFPEGTPYGPEQSTSRRLSLTMQFGGASGNGFISSARLQAGKAQMAAFGRFDKGVFVRDGDLQPGQKRNQDSFEAIWEHVNGRKLSYPKPRFSEPILMMPENFDWLAYPGVTGFETKPLGVFSERRFEMALLRVAPGANGALAPRQGVQIVFVVNGRGTANGQDVRRHSAVSLAAGEHCSLASAAGMEVLVMGLPIFEQTQARQAQAS